MALFAYASATGLRVTAQVNLFNLNIKIIAEKCRHGCFKYIQCLLIYLAVKQA